MPGRWFNFAVLGFWLVSMSWLITKKVLPPLRVGDPPNYTAILQKDTALAPTCWIISWRKEPLGWAASRVIRHSDGAMTSLQGQVFLDHLPLQEMAPGWLGTMLKPLLRLSVLSIGAVNNMDVDALGRLVSFDSQLRLIEGEDAIHVHGQIDPDKLNLHLTVNFGDTSYSDDRHLSPGTFVGDQLAPLSMLPNLKVGQSWTMPVVNPFLPPKDSMELLQATVERFEEIRWHGDLTKTLLVVYRTDAGASLASQHDARSKLWVRPDGLVLKQEMEIMNSTLTFDRGSEKQSEIVSAALGGNWRVGLTGVAARRLLMDLLADSNAH
jgi:hypothetical protein